MSGYTRQSASLIVTNGIITAVQHNAEYDAIEAAFNASTGHNHDGTAGGGAKLPPAALNGVSSDGIVVRVSTSAFAVRTLVEPAAGISITNAGGVAGNPTFALDDDLAAIEALSGTGFAVRTGSNTWDLRTITGTSGRISVSNGNGASGNPTVDLAPSGVVAGTYVSPTVTIDEYGRVTDAVNSSAIPTGALLPYPAITAPTGFVRANGRTIGDASSGATERANADTSDLFTHLWNNFSNTICAVSGGRGGSASVDFAAHKTITLLDFRGRTVAGLDDMGNTAASRVTSTTASPNGTTLGATGGEQTHVLTSAEMPSHAHSGTSYISTSISYASGANSLGIVTGSTNSTGNTGSGTGHNNMSPFMLITWLLKL